MKNSIASRRRFVGAGVCLTAAAAGLFKIERARAASHWTAEDEATVREYYKLWETPVWNPFDTLLADDFTFSSAAGDDHINKHEFKRQCWDTQKDHIARFELLKLYGDGDAAFVMYDGFTKNNRKFHNVEFMRVDAGKVKSIECYFGDKDSFASAVSAGQK